MPAPRKYDQETRDRAIRLYEDRQRDFPEESMLESRRRVGEARDRENEWRAQELRAGDTLLGRRVEGRRHITRPRGDGPGTSMAVALKG
jgi:hypothetical protein